MMRFFLERQLPGELIAFALGMAAANLYTRLRSCEPAPQPLRAIDLAALAFLVLATPTLIHLSFGEILTGVGWRLLGMPLFLVGCTLLVLAAALRTPLIGRIFASAVLVPIGIVSYSLFLWHEPVLRLVATGRLLPNACDGAPCRVALALGLALLVAAASYILTERRRSPRV
jgi:peptidoglycan/LPS O-acetylase OafA/YrhL